MACVFFIEELEEFLFCRWYSHGCNCSFMVTKDFSRMFLTGSCIISHGVGQDHSQNIMSLVDRDTRLLSLF
jgi:hypothetical protein